MFVFFYLDYFFQFLELMIYLLNTVESTRIFESACTMYCCAFGYSTICRKRNETKIRLNSHIISYVQLMLNDLLEGVQR